jgi:hypothetical protein
LPAVAFELGIAERSSRAWGRRVPWNIVHGVRGRWLAWSSSSSSSSSIVSITRGC